MQMTFQPRGVRNFNLLLMASLKLNVQGPSTFVKVRY
jgi:hypothetical protein